MTTLKILVKWLRSQQMKYDKALTEAIHAKQQLTSHQQQLDYLEKVQSDYDCPEGISLNALSLNARRDFQQFLQQMADKQKGQVRKDETEWRLRTEQVTAEKQKLKSIEKLLDKQVQHQQLKTSQQEARELDDLMNIKTSEEKNG